VPSDVARASSPAGYGGVSPPVPSAVSATIDSERVESVHARAAMSGLFQEFQLVGKREPIWRENKILLRLLSRLR
jgi:hypothetical protein